MVMEYFACTMTQNVSEMEHVTEEKGVCAGRNDLNAESTIFFHHFYECPRELLATILALFKRHQVLQYRENQVFRYNKKRMEGKEGAAVPLG